MIRRPWIIGLAVVGMGLPALQAQPVGGDLSASETKDAATAKVQSGDADSEGYILCRGTCDASAVVALADGQFLVADDEDNTLRIYSWSQGGMPLQAFDLSDFLRVDRRSPEVDLEGAAVLGDRVFWISSHARNKKGRERESRHRFFATTLPRPEGTPRLQPVGQPYTRLLADLLHEPRLQPFNLAAAARLAPKQPGGLNIEGLCATPEGHLLIGFRNPIPDGKALVVPLLNPTELIEGRAARLGSPQLLDLGGLGIRDMTGAEDRYYLIAGAYDGHGRSRLYEWRDGWPSPRLMPGIEFAGLNPEAIACVTVQGARRLLVVSDDGARLIDGQACKQLKSPDRKYFRALTIPL